MKAYDAVIAGKGDSLSSDELAAAKSHAVLLMAGINVTIDEIAALEEAALGRERLADELARLNNTLSPAAKKALIAGVPAGLFTDAKEGGV